MPISEDLAIALMADEAIKYGISPIGSTMFALGALRGYKLGDKGAFQGMLAIDPDQPGGVRQLCREALGYE